MLVAIDQIREAAARLHGSTHVTPVLTSTQFNRRCGRQVYFKCENFQKCGSFKIRGALNAVSQLLDERPDTRSVITHSSGNFGQAIAHAAQVKSLECFVVCPENSVASKVAAMEGYGATVIRCENREAARKEKTEKVQAVHGSVFLHPFNQLEVIAGQGTVGLEICDQVVDFDAVLVPVGGGGLCSGVASAIKALRPDCLVYGVEPELAADAKRSFDERRLLGNETYPTTICDGLRTSLGDITFKHILHRVDDILLVSEEKVSEAQRYLFSRMKMCVEPSGAVGAAALLSPEVVTQLPDHVKSLVVVVSGGNWECPGVASH